MNRTTENLLNTALTLPDEDRVELVDALIASLQPQDRPPFDEAWQEVIQRRSAELRSGQVTPVPWEEVRRRSREKFVALRGKY
jgi:putative addiction module component (TIGR02574 family)